MSRFYRRCHRGQFGQFALDEQWLACSLADAHRLGLLDDVRGVGVASHHPLFKHQVVELVFFSRQKLVPSHSCLLDLRLLLLSVLGSAKRKGFRPSDVLNARLELHYF